MMNLTSHVPWSRSTQQIQALSRIFLNRGLFSRWGISRVREKSTYLNTVFHCLNPGAIVMMAPTTYVVSLSVKTQSYQILFQTLQWGRYVYIYTHVFKCSSNCTWWIIIDDVFSEKINFSAHRSSTSANFGSDQFDPLHYHVWTFGRPDCPLVAKFTCRFGFSLNNSDAMHPNGPKCIRNDWIPSLLVSLKHDLEPIYCCFITYFGIGSSLVPSSAPRCPLAHPWPPGAPLTSGMSSLGIVSHSGSFWVMFEPLGASN